MTPTNQGSIRLFRLAGIDLYLHWSWFLVAWYGISQRIGAYSSPAWNVVEYLALFIIVSAHEFGHALACRQVGGHADRIVLWPLGGVAYVDAPQRPGATLWSIAAGPLVNVILLPVFYGLAMLVARAGWAEKAPNLFQLLQAIVFINVVLLMFNLLPIYPLDGGQILRSLLWFVLGRAWSLMVATIIGLIGIVGLLIWAISERLTWLGILTAFILLNCWNGLRHALRLVRLARGPRHTELSCPACQAAPPAQPIWTCGNCRNSFDMFAEHAVCPHCGATYPGVPCPNCGTAHPLIAWGRPSRSEMQWPGTTTSFMPYLDSPGESAASRDG